MLEFKPNNGYDGGGFNHRKTEKAPRLRMLVVRNLVIYAIIFTISALLFGWWSILVDISIVGFFAWLGLTLEKRMRKLDKVV